MSYSLALTRCVYEQVKIMKDWDPTGKRGPKQPLPDVVKVRACELCYVTG